MNTKLTISIVFVFMYICPISSEDNSTLTHGWLHPDPDNVTLQDTKAYFIPVVLVLLAAMIKLLYESIPYLSHYLPESW